jgi:hypothetical protein
VPIIVIALSLVAVVVLWATIGHIGPTHSSDVMTMQRAKLRHRFHLPHKSENTANSSIRKKLAAFSVLWWYEITKRWWGWSFTTLFGRLVSDMSSVGVIGALVIGIGIGHSTDKYI